MWKSERCKIYKIFSIPKRFDDNLSENVCNFRLLLKYLGFGRKMTCCTALLLLLFRSYHYANFFPAISYACTAARHFNSSTRAKLTFRQKCPPNLLGHSTLWQHVLCCWLNESDGCAAGVNVSWMSP
jgi:hypothetical protein